ncbi:MAG: NYN domain-containing protein [Candidatus Edwardsbacteria bacterium]|jgi:predicted RNA-binding protein with PIN domain|nr:NYN domain-containing protein [Candidatus Edwardsbacteria bacterium]
MARHIVVDGYNLAHALRDTGALVRSDRTAARERLLDLLRRYQRVAPAQITVVFDGSGAGPAQRQRIAGIDVRFSRPPQSADDLIRAMVDASRDPGRLLVVSSDRAVSGPVRRRGAAAVRSDEFGDRLFAALRRRDDPAEKPVTTDTEKWLELFHDRSRDEDRQ